MFNSLNVTDCKVNNVDIVTNACTVRSRVIVTEYVNFSSLPTATYAMYGSKLFGIPLGSSPIIPLS